MVIDGCEFRVLACIVAYDPDAAFNARIKKISDQVDHVLVINNFKSRDMRNDAYSVIDNENNGGMAGALNRAFGYARREKYDYLAIFDHDSDVPPGMISALVSGLAMSDAVLMGPIYINSATGRAGRFVLDINGWPISKFLDHDIGIVPAYFIITSGTVAKIESIPVDLKHNEELGVDMVDVDFCLELRKREKKVLLNSKLVMAHGIGNKAPGSRRIDPPNYSVNRHRMIIKNRVCLWRKWYSHYRAYVFLDIAVTVLDFTRNLLLIRKRVEYVRFFFSGFIDGLKSK